MTHDLAYNLILFVIEAAAFVVARRRPGPLLALALGQPVLAALLARLLSAGVFGGMRLLAYAAFIHAPLLLAATAVALRGLARWWSALAAVGALGIVVIGIDAFLIEPHDLQVSHVHLTSPKLTRPVRAVLLADVQMKEVGEYERAAFKTALAQAPDVILMAGDYVQASGDEVRRVLAEYLAAIHFAAPLGVYAVEGNVDPRGWTQLFTRIGAVPFAESGSRAAGELEITGLTLHDSFETKLHVPASEHFHIVLGHGPDYALGDIRADLLVAGHTHGGQVRLPFLGPLVTFSAVPNAWSAGKTDLGQGRTLIVSRGVGMERGDAPPLRFMCRPEIVVIDIEPSGPHVARSRQ